MSVAARQLIDWWRGRTPWVRVALVLILLPLVPALVIAARFGDASAGKAAAAVAGLIGLAVYAGAATDSATPTEIAEVATEVSPNATNAPSPAPTLNPVEQLRADVMSQLGDLRSKVVTVDGDPETGSVKVSTRLPWSNEADIALALELCEEILDGPARAVTIAASSGEPLATSSTTGCKQADRLPIGNTEGLVAALQGEHEEVSGIEVDDARVVVTTTWARAWDTPLDRAEAICRHVTTEAGIGWRVVVQDAGGESLATGSGNGCHARSALPSPEPEPEPVQTSAPAPEPEPVAPPPSNDCHPSYTGACVPANVSDVDCAGGSGNGPFYTGRVNVVGPDVYDLDRDGDGVGCE